MARTAAGREVIASAMKLQIDELEYVIARLIATRELDIPTIQEKSETMQAEIEERQEEREFTINNPVNRQLLVERWEEHFNDLDTEFEGDPFLGDSLALFAYMNAKSSLTLRLIISFMAGNDSSLREYVKRTLLITKEDGSLEIRSFDPLCGILRAIWDIEEKMFVRDASEDSYISDTTLLQRNASPDFTEDSGLNDRTSLRDTSSDWDIEETMSVRDSSVSGDSYVSDTTPLQEESSSDFVEDSELSDGSSLSNTPL
ncbi:hypothetical protein BPAE_0088g00020 [Botrytis paeoniae]|uniref:Uncharacterized protein n=1 Tax=Botrytis paeoniae TaxID=278948 RepID=A0A4Z1FNQ6_9HELO|nr:hypothetical protein BPAE_0088g00020 [Botrytis paeoniae]